MNTPYFPLCRWLSAGGKLVWDVDPAQECITVYSAVAEPTIVQSHESLCGTDVLDGFAVGFSEIFEDLETSNP